MEGQRSRSPKRLILGGLRSHPRGIRSPMCLRRLITTNCDLGQFRPKADHLNPPSAGQQGRKVSSGRRMAKGCSTCSRVVERPTFGNSHWAAASRDELQISIRDEYLTFPGHETEKLCCLPKVILHGMWYCSVIFAENCGPDLSVFGNDTAFGNTSIPTCPS